MKKYFIVRGNFENQYKLYWTTDAGYYPEADSAHRKFDTSEFLSDYPESERITRKEAIAYARAERRRRRENGYFSGYATRFVVPYGAAWVDSAYAHLHTDTTGVIVI